jgi:hypothetical protein
MAENSPFAAALSSFGGLQKEIAGLDHTKTANTDAYLKKLDDVWSTLDSVNRNMDRTPKPVYGNWYVTGENGDGTTTYGRDVSYETPKGVDDGIFQWLASARNNLSNWNNTTRAFDTERDRLFNNYQTQKANTSNLETLDNTGFRNALNGFTGLGSEVSGLRERAKAGGLNLDLGFADDIYRQADLARERENAATNINGRIGGALTAPDGLTIQNKDGINSAYDTLSSLRSTLSDPSMRGTADELASINTALAKVGDLRTQRAAEEKRANDFFNMLTGALQKTSSNFPGLDMRDGTGLESARSYLDTFNNSVNDFKSPLESDYIAKLRSSIDPPRAQAQALLADLQAKRAAAIANNLAGVQGLSSGIDQVELTNDAELQRRLNESDRLKGELAAFTGSDTKDANATFGAAQLAINNRLKQLYDRRSDIEKRAGDALTAARGTNYADYADPSRLSDLDILLESLKAEQGAYKATAANDELAGLSTFLTSTRNRLAADKLAADRRLAADRENVMARQAMDRAALERETAARSQASATPNFLGISFRPLNFYDPNTPVYASNAFSRALGAATG